MQESAAVPELPIVRMVALTSLTFLMLCLYAFFVGWIIYSAVACKGCTPPTERLSSSVTTLQSLVSSLVIAILAISPPKGGLYVPFVSRFLERSNTLVQWMAGGYLIVWLLTGASAFLVGILWLDDTVAKNFSVLVNLGSAWFGLAVAAAYAYLGIEPRKT